DRPERAHPGGGPRLAAAPVRGAARAASAARGTARVREGLPARPRGTAGPDRAPGRRALRRRRLRDARAGAARPGERARAGRPRHVPRLDRRRRPPLAVPDRRPVRRAFHLRAVRAGGARGDGVGVPVPRGGHRRAPRVVPNEDVGLRFRSRDPASLARMAERILTDADLRGRLVTEATEHVLGFDWADVAEQAAAVYEDLTGAQTAAR